MANVGLMSPPSVSAIGKQYMQGQGLHEYFGGSATATASGERIFGNPVVSKGVMGGDSEMPALNPIAGSHNFSFNFGAQNAVGLSRRSGDCNHSDFDLNHTKPFEYRWQGPNNITNAGATAVPKESFILQQKDARVERGNVSTSVNLQSRYVPTQGGAPTMTAYWGQDVGLMKQQQALSNFKQVHAKLTALRAATQQQLQQQ